MAAAQEDMQNPLPDFSSASGSEYNTESEYDDDIISEDDDIDPALPRATRSKGGKSKKPSASEARAAQLTRQIYADFDAVDEENPQPVIFSDDEYDDEDYVDEENSMDIDDEGDLLSNLRSAAHMKRKGPKSSQGFKRQVMRSKEMDPELRTYMSRANAAFVRGDLESAWKSYIDVIKIDNKNFNAYKTLAEISQMQGNYGRSCCYMFMAALSSPSDTGLWGQVAELSTELGFIDQAIYCYTRAIAAKNNEHDYEHILNRSQLYKEKKQFGRALEGLQRLQTQYPEESDVVKVLAEVYVAQRRNNDAINLYMRMLERNMNPSDAIKVPRFGWSELNILLELYINQESWIQAISVLKLVARWIQRRSDETWWDEQDDDAEFDDRRPLAIRKKKPQMYEKCVNRPHHLPIDIRFKLGCLRLELDQKDEAVTHLRFLNREADKRDVADLFYSAGKNLELKGHYEEAISFLKEVDDDDLTTDTAIHLGQCYYELGDFKNAKVQSLKALRGDPDNVDVKLNLVQALIGLDERDAAKKLLQEIENDSLNKRDKEDKAAESSILDDEDNLALIGSARNYKDTKKEAMTEEQKAEIEKTATRMVLEKFSRMEKLQEQIDRNNNVAAMAWMKLASQLIDMFTSIKAFFPRSTRDGFRGVVMYLRRKQDSDIYNRLARIHNLYEGISDTTASKATLISKSEFRGLTYDQWLYIFVQNALLLRYFNNDIKEAVNILEVAFDVNVFIQDKQRSMLLRLARLSLAINQQDFIVSVCNNVRYVLSSTQFSSTIYATFMCCFASGISAWAAFSNYNHQKYFLRQLKAYDSLRTSTEVSGAAHVTVDVKNMKFDKELPSLLYIYACLLGSNRTFSSPIVYLTRAYKEYYNDPTICLMLGLAHVHRSMQRNSSNRHMQLLQGISYLLEYKEHRSVNSTVYEKQEIEYNFGRLFHMLGLPALAIDHYNKVLSFHEQLQNDPDYDLSIDAAYNLTLIYTINGNTKMTQNLTNKYLTI
ncbi:hypothetical protein CJI97_004646 [Candidozyma auris]|nr:hypothetical protein CJI97_004646 [[Candida] auris]